MGVTFSRSSVLTSALTARRVRFGAFELDLSTGELRSIESESHHPNNKVLLREQVFQVLRMLLEREGKIVTREEIKNRLWPNDTVVDFDHSINAAIKTLRRALGDSADDPRYIETLARRGYRLMVMAEYLEPSPGGAPGEVPAGPTPVRSTSLIGKKVSHYRVLEVIGGGGMGLVFKAEDLKLGRPVALKFLPEEFAGDAVALKRFEREARTASALNHPNICTIYEIEEHEGQPFIAMELLQGDTLRDHLSASKQKPLPLPELLGISAQICDGLQAAHEKGIVHRDIKPANIFLCKSGTVKILDFGLAKLAGAEVGLENAEAVSTTERATPSAEGLKNALTRTGATAGTAGYMSPEQVRQEELDTRSDLFSFGLVVYEMACGERAFTGQTLMDVQEAILHQPPAPARACNPHLPRSLDLVLAKALKKDRGRRYQSATALKDDLIRITREVHPARRWARKALATVALLAVGAVSLWRYEAYRHRITLALTDTIVLAGVDNRTKDDPVFDDALNTALRYEMEQTPYLNVLGLDKAYATMGQLKLAPTTRITPEIARQICGKTNSKMVISDSIADAGNRYHLEMRALDCESGATVAEERTDTSDRNQVVHELGATALRLRRKLGEPVESLTRFNQPLEKATSASLEALQTGAEGSKQFLAGNPQAALKIFQQAAELDPNFALAHWRMGAASLFLGDTELSAASYTRAYQLRDRLTEKDRLGIEIDYYGRVTGDWEKEYSSVLRFLEIFPRDVLGHTNLRAAFVYLGQPDRAADEAAEVARLRPSSYYFGSAIQSIRFASRFSVAKSWLAKADALKLDNSLIRRERLIVAFATGDWANVEKILKEEEQGSYREDFLHEHSLIEIQQGRFHSAERLRQQALGTSKAGNDDWWVVLSALENAEVGMEEQARRYESKAAERPLERDNKIALALALARSGRTEEAGRLADQISEERPEDTLVQHYFIPTIRAAIKLRQDDPAAAIDLLRGTAKYDLAFTGSFNYVYPAYIRGLAYARLGEAQSAAVQFQKLIDNPGFSVRHVIGPLARLQLGRAQKMMGDNASAHKSYEEFLNTWKDADPDLPIYRQAKAEYARLGDISNQTQ